MDTINAGGDKLYTADQICRMVEFLIDNIFVKFRGCIFCQVIGIPMGKIVIPLPPPPPPASRPLSLLLQHNSEFLDNIIRSNHRRLARSFNLLPIHR